MPLLVAPEGESRVRGTVLRLGGGELADLDEFVGARWRPYSAGSDSTRTGPSVPAPGRWSPADA